jgi:hypothetical protein
MDLLNLDDLAKVEKSLKLKGKKYPIVELSVENFIAAMKEAEELDAKGDLKLHENIARTVQHIARVIPTLPEEDIRGLTVPQLTALVAFVNGTVQEQGAKPASTEPQTGEANTGN